MRIKQVRIKNFRTLQDVTINVEHDVTTLIGPNGSGKSTFLYALDWFFNAPSNNCLCSDDCFAGNDQEPIEVGVTFSELDELDHRSLGKYAPEGTSQCTIWKRRNVDGREYLSGNTKRYHPFESVRTAVSATDKRNAYKKIRESCPELELPSASSAGAAEEALVAWESEHIDKLEDMETTIETNFFGFNGTGKMSDLFNFVFVGADLRAAEETEDNKSTIIGKILERSIDRTVVDEQIQAIIATAEEAEQKVYNEGFGEQLQRLSAKLTEKVSSFSYGREVAVENKSVEIKPTKTTFGIRIDDGSMHTNVAHQGHGFQRTLLISALSVLAESKQVDTQSTICLAIEEPELYQHPIQARLFAKVIRELASDEQRRIQVIYVTHSPTFIEAGHFSQIRRFSRDQEGNVTVAASYLERIKQRIAGVADPERVRSQLDAKITGELAEALFDNKVLLVEGTTEVAVLSGIADREIGTGALESRGIGIISSRGKTKVLMDYIILTELGIETFVMVDSDAGFMNRMDKNSTDEEKKREAVHINENHTIERFFGLNEEDFPSGLSDGNRIAFVPDTLESFLAKEWPDWQKETASWEAANGIKLTKNQESYREVTSKISSEPPQLFQQVLDMLLKQ